MPRTTKTVRVADLKRQANTALAVQADSSTPEFRRGVIAVIESVLMNSGNYNGFGYTNLTDDMKDAEGYLLPGQPADDTRRRYF